MSGSGGGGGVSLFGAWAFVRMLFSGRKSADEVDRRAALDAEELREVEYENMGLPVPPRADDLPGSRPSSRLARLMGRRNR